MRTTDYQARTELSNRPGQQAHTIFLANIISPFENILKK